MNTKPDPECSSCKNLRKALGAANDILQHVRQAAAEAELSTKEDVERGVESVPGCQMCRSTNGLSHGVGLLSFGVRKTPLFLDIRRKNLKYDEWNPQGEEGSFPFFLCGKCRIRLLKEAILFEEARMTKKEEG
jgi:hypothetical protein